ETYEEAAQGPSEPQRGRHCGDSRARDSYRRESVGLGQRNVLLVGGPAGRSCGGSLLLVLHVQLPPVPRRRDHSRLSRVGEAVGGCRGRPHRTCMSTHLTWTPEPATISPMTG